MAWAGGGLLSLAVAALDLRGHGAMGRRQAALAGLRRSRLVLAWASCGLLSPAVAGPAPAQWRSAFAAIVAFRRRVALDWRVRHGRLVWRVLSTARLARALLRPR
jgi:hypothetical protein